jgi:hypothetical protein
LDTPRTCDAVFAVINPEPRLVILDWDIVQIEGFLLEAWLPQVFGRLEELARETRLAAAPLASL